MTTREYSRTRVERAREERREQRFVKSLEDAREAMDSVIEKAERGSALTFDALEDLHKQLDRVYWQAGRMEGDEDES